MDRDDGVDEVTTGEGEGAEVELVDDQVMDARAAPAASPGEPRAGEPVEEVLHVRAREAAEPPPDQLDVPEGGPELREPDEGEEPARPPATPDEFLHRNVVAGDLEIRHEELDSQDVAARRLERVAPAHAAGAIRCTRCFVWKHPEQFTDVERRICSDCA